MGLQKGLARSFSFGLSVAVGLTPEMLPEHRYDEFGQRSKCDGQKGTVIRNLNAIQNFGAIVCYARIKRGH